MPIDLIPLDMGRRMLAPGDTGFLVSCKNRYYKNLQLQARKFLFRFTQRYYEARFPEEAAAAKAAKEQDMTEKGDTAAETEVMKEEIKEEIEEEKEEEAVKKEGEDTTTTPEKKIWPKKKPGDWIEEDMSGIKFVTRETVYDNCEFIASNLADPTDFLHFVFYTMVDQWKHNKKPKFPMKFMPVNAVCEARAKFAETTVRNLVADLVGEDHEAIRFSITCKGTMEGEHMKQKEASTMVRNVIWSLNPCCIQCIKYQDFAVIVDILDPFLCIGIGKDFYLLGNYNTSNAPHGVKTEPEIDSEDDISDDPNLDEEDNRKRILRIKRKRRAEKAELAQSGADAKKNTENNDDEEEDGDGDVKEEDDHEEDDDDVVEDNDDE